ncbi:MAG TPA: Hpt domain-containing protein [Pirellulales bacterium]|nr:Hpt domain-containing protein [Pirellulales bacterium]
MSTRMTPPEGLLYSSLAFDADMAPLVHLFVDDLPDRAKSLLDRLQASDFEGLRRLAHQMSGAAGSYGFAEITTEAAALEAIITRGGAEDEIAAGVNAVIDLLRRARSGTGEDSVVDSSF